MCVLRAVLIGGKLMPGGGGGECDVTSELTSWSAMVLPDEFPRPGKLLYFSAFFVASTPVYLQIWRPVNGSNDLMSVHSQKVFPRTVNQVETVSVDRRRLLSLMNRRLVRQCFDAVGLRQEGHSVCKNFVPAILKGSVT